MKYLVTLHAMDPCHTPALDFQIHVSRQIEVKACSGQSSATCPSALESSPEWREGFDSRKGTCGECQQSRSTSCPLP